MLISLRLMLLGLLLIPVTGVHAQLAVLYPNDAGIENDPDVLYVEKFEGSLPNILSRYSDVINAAGMSLDNDVPAGSRGMNSIRMTNVGGANSGGHLFRKFSPGWDSTIYLRYYVKYPLISKGYIHHESVWIGGYNPATGWPSPQAGTCGLGDSRISIAYEPINEPAMDTYLYWGGMQSWNGGGSCYGNDMINGSATAQNLAWDNWMCVEIMVKLNNPVTASNGELRIWQNGVEVGYWGPGFPRGHWVADSWFNVPSDPPFPGFRWRTNPSLNINYVWIEYYDDTSPKNVSHYIKYDHLVIARKYIGPLSTSTGVVALPQNTSSVRVYPNPSDGKIMVDMGKRESGKFEVFNLSGKRLYQSALTGAQSRLNLHLARGVYMYQLKSNHSEIGKGKLIIH